MPRPHHDPPIDPAAEDSAAEDEVASELEQRYVELCECLSILSHDLRTPLTTIRGYAQLLERQARADQYASLRPNIGLIIRECDRLAAQTQLLLDIGRISTRRIGLRRAPLDLHHVTQEALRRAGADVPLYPTQSPGNVTVHADVDRVVQMVQAMLRFATGARDGAPVHASIDSDGTHAHVVVEHGGPPLEPDQRDQLLQQLVRLPDEGGHRELAHVDLVIAAGLAEAHGGCLRVDTPAQDGRGVRLTLTLPLDV